MWEVVDGTYHGHTVGYNVAGHSAVGELSWTDYRIEFDVMASGSKNQLIAFRLTSPDDYYFVNARSTPWNDIGLYKSVGGVHYYLAAVPFVTELGEWHHMSVEAVGATTRVVCDGIPAFEYVDTDAPFLNGKVAAFSWSGGSVQYQDIYFDNMIVTAMNVPDGATFGPVTASSDALMCGETLSLDFHYARGTSEAPPVHGYSVRVLAPETLLFSAEDIVVNSLPDVAATHYEILENGVNDFTIDFVAFGSSTGIVDDADLFSIEFHPVDSGVAIVAVTELSFRDAENHLIPVVPISATVKVDCSAPGPVENLVANPGHETVTLNWSSPVSGDKDALEVWRAMWQESLGHSTYPEYDDYAGNIIPTRWATRDEVRDDPLWVLVATLDADDECFVDSVTERGIYCYEVFARATTGLFGPPSAENVSATNYWLGDLSTFDGAVDISDLVVLAPAYGSTPGDVGVYDRQCDIGPTFNLSPRGIPATDNMIDFEDLMILGLNFGVTTPGKTPAASGTEVFLSWKQVDDQRWSLHLEQPCPGLAGLNIKVPLQAGTVASLSGGELLRASGVPYFLQNIDSRGLDIGLMVPGNEAWSTKTGELFTVSMTRAVDPGRAVVKARTASNSDIPCELERADRDVVPSTLRLLQNYPNPFNPSTTIRFSLPEKHSVSLAVFDLGGRRVAGLVDGTLERGDHDFVWSGRNDSGKSVASGTYVYRLRVGAHVETMRMTLLK